MEGERRYQAVLGFGHQSLDGHTEGKRRKHTRVKITRKGGV